MSAYYNEIDPHAADWLRNLIKAGHIADGIVDTRSISDIEPNDLRDFTQCHFFAGIGVWSLALRLSGWSDDRPVWTGSCPCQPFSSAGRSGGFADERHLWPHWHHLIRECRPAVVFGEQVASKAVEPWIDLVHTDLEALGYAFAGIPFPSAGVGAPHIRDRLFWVGERLANVGSYGPQGRVQGRTYSQRQAEHGSLGRGGPAGGLGDPDDSGRQSQPTDIRIDGEGMESSRGQPVARVKTSGDVSIGLADSNGEQRHGSRIIRPGGRAEPADGGAIARREPPAGPTNGFWGTADWLLCRDGKWRPVIATHVALVDGPSSGLVRVRAGEEEQGEVNGLQALSKATGSEAVFKWGLGESVHAIEAQVLQPGVHGSSDAKREVLQPEPQQDQGIQNDETDVRGLREDRQLACTPRRPRSSQQHHCELEDALRFLSSSLSLAELHDDRATTNALQALQRAIREAGDLRDPSEPIEAVWTSLSEEKKDRLRLAFDASRWAKVVDFPLTNGESNRVGRLRAYGNAINAQAATEFIGAYLDARTVEGLV